MQLKRNQLGQVSDFEIRLLRVFMTVVEHGGFSAAESVLGISRSAISQHMGDLEKRLNLRLCRRGRAGFSLTNEGRAVYRASQTLLSAVEGFRAEVNSLHKGLRGDLRIGIFNNLVSYPATRVTNAFRTLKRYGPDVHIKISMTTPQEIETGVLNGHLHVGAVPMIAPLSGLEYIPLYEETSLLYCSNNHPFFRRRDADISMHEISTAEAVRSAYRLPVRGQECHRRLHCTASSSDREGVAYLILTDDFIGYLPDHYAARWVASGEMRPLHPESLNYSIMMHIIVRKGRRSNMVLQVFLDGIRSTEPPNLVPQDASLQR